MTTAACISIPTADVRSVADPIVRNFDAMGPTANAGRPSRFRKDILRVGRFYPGGKPWDVDSLTLRAIADSFHRARDNGNRIPLVWDHSNSSRANAGEVVDLAIEGDTLFATVHAQDPDAKRRLGVVNNDVSVQVVAPWTDGKGNHYDAMLTHVAIVNHPVMTDQGEFHEFSNRGPEMARTINMQTDGEVVAEDSAAEGAAEGGDDTMMPVADVIAILESALGVKFPPEVDTKKELKIALDAMMGGGAAAEEATEAAAAAPDALEGMEVQQLSLPAARNALAATQKQLAAVMSRQREQAESAFRSRLSGLEAAGRVATRHTPGLVDAGRAAQWSMSLLAPFDDDLPTMPTGQPKATRLATATVPGDPNAAEIKRHQNRFRARMGLAPE